MAENALTIDEEIELLELELGGFGGKKRPVDTSFGEKTAEVARSVGRGVGHLAEFAGDMYDIPRAGLDPTKSTEEFLNTMNPFGTPDPGDLAREELSKHPLAQAMTEEKIKRGESTGLDMSKTAAEWAPTVLAPGSVGANVVRAGVTGLSAATGEQIGGEGGEIFGGLFGALSAGKLQQLFTGTVNFFKRSARTEESAMSNAAQFMKDNADDVENAVANLTKNIDEGVEGTSGQLAADRGFLAVEDKVSSPEGLRLLDQAKDGRSQQIINKAEEAIAPLTSPGLPLASQGGAARLDLAAGKQNIRAQAQGTKAEARGLEQSAQQQRDAASAVVTPSETTYGASEGLAATIDDARNTFNDTQVKPLWDKFDSLAKEPSQKYKDLLSQHEAGLSPTELNSFRTNYRDDIRAIRELQADAEPSEIAFIVSGIKKNIANKKAQGTASPADAFATRLSVDLEQSLTGNPATKSAYDDATRATREMNDKFSARNQGKQRRLADDEILGTRIVRPGDAGASDAANLSGSGDDAIAQAGEYLKALAQREGLDAKFVKKYEAYLNEFPDQTLVAELRAAATSADTLAATSKQTVKTVAKADKKQGKQLRKLDKATVAQFVAKPEATMKRLLTSEDARPQLQRLVNKFGADSVRDTFKQSIIKRLTTEKGGLKSVQLNAIDEFNNMKGSLDILFKNDPKGLAELTSQVFKVKIELLRGAKVDALGTHASEVERLGASVASAGIMTGLSGTQSLLIGSALRRNIMALMGKGDTAARDPATMKALNKLLADPKLLVDEIGKLKDSAHGLTRVREVILAGLKPNIPAAAYIIAAEKLKED